MNQSHNQDPLYAGPRQRPAFEGRGNPSSPPTTRLEPRQNDIMESNQSRAARYEDEKRRIIESCFSKKEADGVLQESYITHVRVTEDAMFPSAPPPPDSPAANKKGRVILVAVRKSGRVRVHKARENPTGSFSIGKTWALDELSAIQIYTGMVPRNNREQLEQQWASDVGFMVTLGKPYYWQAPTAKEKDFFIASLIKIYRKYTGGKIPELSGFLPHQVEQLAGQTPKATPEPVARSPPPQAIPISPQPLSAARERTPQPTYSGQSRDPVTRVVDQPTIPSRRNEDGSSVGRDGQISPVPEPLRSPARGNGITSNRDIQRKQRTPEPPSQQSPYKDVTLQTAPVASSSFSSESSRPSITQHERSITSGGRGVNGLAPSTRTLVEHASTVSSEKQSKEMSRERTGSSTAVDDLPSSEHLDHLPTESKQVPSRSAQPDRRRPYLGKPEMTSSQKSLPSSESSRFATPATTPSVVKNEPVKPIISPAIPLSQPKEGSAVKDYFGTTSKAVQPLADKPLQTSKDDQAFETPISKPVPEPVLQQMPEPKIESPATPIDSHVSEHAPEPLESVVSNVTTAEPEVITEPKAEEEDHRPGLGPMIKKKPNLDVANKFRKAALAANAFKPREGGAAARLKALQEKENKSNEPDGITGVVPAPLHRGMSSDSTKPVRPDTPSQMPEKDLIPTPLSGSFAPKVQLQRAATEESLHSQDSTVKSKAETPVVSPQPEITPQPTDPETSQQIERALSPDKARSRSPQRRKRQRQEAEVEKYCSALGVDPRLFEGRGTEFNDLLSEFGWEGKLKAQEKVDEFEASIRREIGRAQATGWLGHVEQQEGKLQELAKAFDKAVEECEELEGLFTLYSHELDTLAEDIEYIEAQSQGLQVQTANQKLLHTELQNLLTTLSIPSEELRDLRYMPLDNGRDIASVEQALVLLYKALVTLDPESKSSKHRKDEAANTNKDGEGIHANNEIGQMRAVREKREEYQEAAMTFVLRFQQHMKAMFKDIEQRRSEDNSRSLVSVSTASMESQSRNSARQQLWLYNAMMLFVRDFNDFEWQTLISNYGLSLKGTYQDQFREDVMNARKGASKPTGEELECLFTHQEKERTEDSLATSAARRLTVKRGKTVKASALRNTSNGERRDGKPEAWEALQAVVLQQVKIISEEQNFIVNFFHVNSLSSTDFAELVMSHSPEMRHLPNLNIKQSYDPDRGMAKSIHKAMEEIYSFWTGELQALLEWVLGIDQLQGVGVLCVLEQTLAVYEETNQEYITRALRTVHDRLVTLFHKFIDEQVRAVEETKVRLKKRRGIISFMRTFPAFSASVENMMPSEGTNHESLEVRFIVNEAYAKILKAMWESLSFIAKENPATGNTAPSSNTPPGGDPEDKEALNYHVLLIENMSHYLDEVDTHRNLVLEEWADRAKHDMYTHLTQYTDAIIRRPLGKWLDFVESTEAMMKTNESYQHIANRPSHSRSAAKKVLKSYDTSEIRKGVDTLRKRIEKHFGDLDDPMATSKSLISKVFEDCNSRYAHAYDRMKLIIDKVYDASLEIDWRKEEIATMFKR